MWYHLPYPPSQDYLARVPEAFLLKSYGLNDDMGLH